MPKATHFKEYCDRYPNVRFERTDDGVLLMQLHTDGGSFHWDSESHDSVPDAFADVAGDRDLNVVILSGAGAVLEQKVGPYSEAELEAKLQRYASNRS